MTALKNQIILNRYNIMQMRARGLDTTPYNALAEDNKRMAEQIQSQLHIIVALRDDLSRVIAERDQCLYRS